jgi:hypothetical protein
LFFDYYKVICVKDASPQRSTCKPAIFTAGAVLDTYDIIKEKRIERKWLKLTKPDVLTDVKQKPTVPETNHLRIQIKRLAEKAIST